MADIIEGQQQAAPEVNQADAAQAELAQHMAISLNGGIVPQVKNEPPAGEGGAATEVIVPVVTDVFAPFKEKFGHQTPEDAIKEIEELRAFKASPPTELKYENELSEQLFKAIQRGDRKEVTSILKQQERLDELSVTEVTKDNVDDMIKFGMSLKYKDLELTTKEIDYKFNKQFALPKEPVQSATEEDEDFAVRKSEWQEKVAEIEMDKMIEAKLMKPDFEKAKKQLVLPEIDSDVDEDYLQWQKTMEENEKSALEAKEIYKTFTPEGLETKLPFNDETNKVAFEYQFKPDAESFSKVVSLLSNADEFKKEFTGQDGKPDRKKFLEVIYYGLNRQKAMTEAMNQSKNATLKSQLPDNSQGGMVRQLPQGQQEFSELDKQMKVALAGHI